MISFSALSILPRNFICFWAIVLIAGFLISAILSVEQKRYAMVLVDTAAAFLLYFLMEICRGISVGKLGGPSYPLAEAAGTAPFGLYPLLLALLSLLCVFRLKSCLGYARAHITPMAVKEAVDQNPAGICCYRKNGQVILANHRMQELAFAITGRWLLNGCEFYEALGHRHLIELPDKSVIRFSHRLFLLASEPCYELLAEDITELYRRSEALQKETQRLAAQNRIMKEYSKTIDETVRRQEVLNTKIRIHDEMNRLLLATEKSIRSGNPAEQESVQKTWQKNILLLCMEGDSQVKNNALADLDALAAVIGIRLVYDRVPQTKNAEALLLFSQAAEEAMTNAVKHAGASSLHINVLEEADRLTVTFTNDGSGPVGPVMEGGGLTALRRRLEKAGGTMGIDSSAGFALTLTIPKGGYNCVL